MPLQVNYILEHGDRFLLSTEILNQLHQGYSDWTAAFFLYQYPKFHTNLRRKELEAIWKQQDGLLRKIHNHVKASQLIELTEEDRIALNIPIEKSHHNIVPAPTITPTHEVTKNGPG